MTPMRWAEISIDAAPSAQDAVGDALLRAGCAGWEVRDSLLPPQIAGYLPVDDRLESRLEDLQAALDSLPTCGVVGAGRELTLRTLEEADWANAWKAFFKPTRVGRRLVVTPPWESPDLSPGDLPLVIDPGMAFGTGSHPTTQLCLRALEDYVRPGMRVADLGTGSGILAIAAVRLGASTVEASDIDPLAVRIARENFAVNNVSASAGETLPPGPYALVVANILADVIIALAETLADLLAPDGVLIASGIIDTRETDVRIILEGAGFAPLEARHDGEWVALVLRRASS